MLSGGKGEGRDRIFTRLWLLVFIVCLVVLGLTHFLSVWVCHGGAVLGTTLSPLSHVLLYSSLARLPGHHELSTIALTLPYAMIFLPWTELTMYWNSLHCQTDWTSPLLICGCQVLCPSNRKADWHRDPQASTCMFQLQHCECNCGVCTNQ